MGTVRAASITIVAAISTVFPATAARAAPREPCGYGFDGVPGSHAMVFASPTKGVELPSSSTAAPDSTVVIGDGGAEGDGAGDAVRVGIGLALIVGAVGATVLLTRRKARGPLAR